MKIDIQEQYTCISDISCQPLYRIISNNLKLVNRFRNDALSNNCFKKHIEKK